MSQRRQWIPLDDCITAYMDEAELSNHKYFKLWHLAYRAMSELGLDAFYPVVSVKLPVLANLTVTLPSDYQQYSKIGVLNEQGNIIPLSVNNNLTTAYDLQAERLEKTQDNTIPTQLNEQGVWWYNYWNGGARGAVYGLPSGSPFVGNFKIDEANGVIVLSENFSYEYVMLEYVATPAPNGGYAVPIQFKEAIISYLAWKDIRYIPSKTHVHNSSVAARRRDFYNERDLAIRRYDPVRLQDLYQWNLENQRITVKA